MKSAKSLWASVRPYFRGSASFAIHVLRAVDRHDCLGMAAEIAFQMMFAFFQALILLVAVLSILGANPDVFNSIIYLLGSFLPFELYSLIRKQITEIAAATPTGILTFSILGTTWTMMNLMFTMKKSLERSYHVKETRPMWKVRLIVLWIGSLVTISIAVVQVLLLFGLQISHLIENTLGIQNIVPVLIRALRLPVAGLVTTIVATLLYWALANVRERIIDVVPGAVFFCIFWFILTYGFSQYIRNFPYFNKTYGTLGVFVVLMVWMYLTALTLLVGGEVNAETYRRVRREMKLTEPQS